MSDTSAPGYSGKPLAQKLGLKAGQSVAFVALPPELQAMTGAEAFERADGFDVASKVAPEEPYDVIWAFYDRAGTMQPDLGCLKGGIKPNGMIWVSWPKKASGVASDITEDTVREAALAHGLVDVKVCAVSDVWSGLKLVIPVSARG